MSVDQDPSLRKDEGSGLPVFGAPPSLEEAIRVYQDSDGLYSAALEFLEGAQNGLYDNPRAVERYAEALARMADFIDRVGVKRIL